MRPLYSHSQQGEKACTSGACEGDNPYKNGSIANLQWDLGYHSQLLENNDIDLDLQVDVENRIADLEALVVNKVTELWAALPKVDAVVSAIDVPLNKWPSNCFAISVKALESGIYDQFQADHGPVFPSYGAYFGEITKKQDRFINRHGWLESQDGFVIDHTRWVFTETKPAVWLGQIDEYDLAGMRTRLGFRPESPPIEATKYISVATLNEEEVDALDLVLGGKHELHRRGSVSHEALHWVLTSPLDFLGSNCSIIFGAAEKLKMSVMIPIDNRNWVEYTQNGYSSKGIVKTDTPTP